MASIALTAGGQAGLTDRLTGVVLPGLEATLQRVTADADQWLALLSQVFAHDEAGSQELFAERAEQVREAIAAGSLSLTLELRTAEELQGGLAAYAAGAGERIYLNADWAVTATDQQLERVLLEEFGHALDQRLNGGLDTAGDEGEAFAALVFDGRIDPAVWEEKGEQESGTLWIDGVEVEVEFAKYNFVNAYRMVYDLNNDGLVKGSDSETAAEKEQSIHNFNVVGLGNVQINDGSASLNFSGNDISATAITIGGKVYYGWISRPIKANGIVRGFYFWTDRDFTDLTLAQFDGNADGDGSSADNRGFLLVVDQAWFDGQIAATSKTININNAIDGNLGAIAYATVGSSSDRVDSALNDLPVSQQFVDTTDTDKDGVINFDDLDDDNDGILDVVEQQRPGATPLSPSNITFNYAQNTLGFASFHDAAGAYKTGDRNDPAFLFDGKIETELRVHQNDVYEFGLPRTLAAGTSFSLTEGTGSNDKKIAVLGSFGSTDSTGNSGNATGAGQGWKTIATAFGVSTVGQLEALFQANNNKPVVRGDLILLFAGASDKTEIFTTSIDINHFQLVGLETHGGWADLSISVESSQPLDIDGDSIPNYLDLDSDNDGISDLYEAVGSNPAVLAVAIDANNDGTITQAEVTDYNTKNSKNYTLSSSGVWSFLGDPNVANDGQEPLDSDDDTIADFLDLDSDNDGIADTIEARLSSGYSTNDGDVRNEDADGDGVIARFDSNDANATKVFGGSFGTPVNTDSNKGGDGTTTTNAGHADKVQLDNSVDSEANALGAYDGKLAKLNDSKDQLILDLGKVVPNGTTIKILAKKDDKDAANQITIGQSLDGTAASVSNSKSSGFTAKDVLQEITYTTSGDSRYISIKFAKKKGNLYVDGLVWNYGSTTNAFTPDYLDADSDNDGVNDATESGLTRTGKDVNGDGIDDNVGASYADPDGSVNDPLLTSIGLKNNDKDASDVDYRSLNTGGVLINSVRVNEGSPWAVFSLTGPTSATSVKLRLINDLDPDTANATIGTDLAADPFGGSVAVSVVQFLSGNTWTDYNPANGVTIPANGTLLVRVQINNDTPAVFEGEEIFRLVATDNNGAVSQGGLGTIVDDGSGDGFSSNNKTATPNTDNITLDDDSSVDINSVTVNEGSPYAVFSLTGNPSAKILLSLANDTDSATKDATLGTDTGAAATAGTIQYWSGSAWTNYSTSVNPSVNLDSEGALLVRVKINNDTQFEQAETFRLVATVDSNKVTSTGGIGTIVDDGTGTIFANTVTNGVPDVNAAGPFDDDSPITIDNPIVNEGSKWAVFDLEGVAGLQYKLSLTAQTASFFSGVGSQDTTGGTHDYGPIIQYKDASGAWQDYNLTTAPLLAMDSAGHAEVRVAILQDSKYEGAETFKLVATSASNVVSTGGQATIRDDGTGQLLNTLGNVDNVTAKDDDRAITVSGLDDVSEGSDAIFTVTLPDGNPRNTDISLALSGISATAAVDYSNTFTAYYYNGSTKVDLPVTSGKITLPTGVPSFFVNVPTSQDPTYEGKEDFRLTATIVSGNSGNDTSSIVDDGSGKVYNLDGTPNDAATPDDDRPTIAVSSVTVSEESPFAVVEVSLSTLSNSAVSFTPSLVSKTATKATPPTPYAKDGTDDFGPDLQYLDSSDNTWKNVTGPLTIPAGSTSLLLRTAIIDDDAYEISEVFEITTGAVSGVVKNPQGVAGTVTIKDDGSPDVATFLDGNKTSTPDSIGPAENDKVDVFVLGGTFNEGSKYAIFTVGNTPDSFVNLIVQDGSASVLASGGQQPEILYSIDGGASWVAYTWDGATGNRPKAPLATGGEFLVAVNITREADTPFEGAETFTLKAQDASDTDEATGTATIVDDGTGKIVLLLAGKPVGGGNAVIEDTGAAKDDDRGVTVVGKPDVSEGSNAIFTVTLTGNPDGTDVSLVLGKAGDTAGVGDYSALAGATAYYYVGSTKTALPISAGKVTLPAGVTSFFVSVPTTQDGAYEGPESVTLQATAFGGAKSGSDSSTVLDDGSGKRYDDEGTEKPGTPQDPFTADDDRLVTVTGKPDVSEGSNAIFTVALSGNPGPGAAEVSLLLGKPGDDTAESDDYSPLAGATAYYYVGSTKTNLPISAGKVFLPVGITSFFVSVPTTVDGVYEGPESVTLEATAFGGAKSASGSSVILDNGGGKIYDDKGDATNGTPDDDRPTITVSSLTLAENNPSTNNPNGFAVVDVNLSNPSAETISFLPFLAALTANNPGDYGPGLEYSLDGGSGWLSVTGPIGFDPGVQAMKLRTPIFDDSIFDPNEQFTVNTGKITAGTVKNPSGTTGIVTITDNEVQSLGNLSVTTKSTGRETGVVPNVFVVTRTGSTAADLVVPFSLSSSTAKLVADFTTPTFSTSGSFDSNTYTGFVTIPAGSLSAEITVPTVDNATLDGTRSVVARLSPVAGYNITSSLANGSILDNDDVPQNPVITLGNGTVVETNPTLNRTVDIAISMDRKYTQDVTIQWATRDATLAEVAGRSGILSEKLGVATGASQIVVGTTDYRSASGKITLKAGVQSAFITIPVVADLVVENDELFYVTITDVALGGVSVGNSGSNKAEIIIVDNDTNNNIALDYSGTSSTIDLRGGTGNDNLKGSTVGDYIYGNAGNDTIEGREGADVLTGEAGADVIVYNDTGHSLRNAMDNLRGMAFGGASAGDRILFGGAAASSRPTAIFNATRTKAVVGLDGPSGAIQAAFDDVNPSVGQAVIFSAVVDSSTRSYMAVNLGSASYESGTDFMVDITGWNSSGTFATGALAVSDFFR